MRKELAIAVSVFGLLAGSAWAADAPARSAAADSTSWVSVNKMVGNTVVNAAGEELGEVEDVVMSRTGNRLQAVIDVEDSDRDVVVDATKLTPRADHRKQLVLQGVTTRQQLAGMTAFEGDRMRATTTAAAGGATIGTVGTRESDRPNAAPTPDRISMERMVGRSVVDAEGHKIGDVEDVILDKTGLAKQVVIDLDWSTSDVAVDFKQIQPNARDMDQLIAVGLNRTQLDAMPKYDYDADTVALKQK